MMPSRKSPADAPPALSGLRLATLLGWRFALSSRHKGFLTLVSWVSLLGMMLGVAALIIVLSVMNGFHQELKTRLLVLVPQWRIEATGEAIAAAAAVEAQLQALLPEAGLSPYIESTVLLSAGQAVRGARLLAVLPAHEPHLQAPLPDIAARLLPGSYHIVLGRGLARQLGVLPGDRITVMLPRVTLTPAGAFPRTRVFTVADILSTGSQADAEYALVHLDDARRLFRLEDAVHGFRLTVPDGTGEAALAARLQPVLQQQGMVLSDWRRLQGPLFDAVQMEKRMIALLLFVVVMVAAFNIVSMVAISVSRKRSAIAILRAMGAGRSVILGSFVVQGLVLGLVGIIAGMALGLLLASQLNAIIHGLESASGRHLFDPAVFYIVDLPVQVRATDVAWIVGGAWWLALLSCLVPAWQAARLDPVAGLRP